LLRHAVIEYARNVLRLQEAHSTECMPHTKHPIVAMLQELKDHNGTIQIQDTTTTMGGSMRLGAQNICLTKESFAHTLYKSTTISERHRHRYEINPHYLAELAEAGCVVSGENQDKLVEIIEIPTHPWFIGCQFHPEFTSKLFTSHPLFMGFVRAALAYKEHVTI